MSSPSIEEFAEKMRCDLLQGKEVDGCAVDRLEVDMCIWELSERTTNRSTGGNLRQHLAVPGIYWCVSVVGRPGAGVEEGEAFAIARKFAGRAPEWGEGQALGALASVWFVEENSYTLWQPVLPDDYKIADENGPL